MRPADVTALVTKYLTRHRQGQEEIQDALRRFLAARPADPKTSEQIKEVFGKLGFKRYETYEHSARVASYCGIFGQRCGLSESELQHLELGALLHDIGKIGIPRNVLMKPGPLNDDEWRVMRVHPSIGHRLLRALPELSEEAEIVYSHHERYDGSGYPRALRGDQIPLGARIFSIVDTFDAITSDRPHRAARSIEAARSEIKKLSGIQFDPALVKCFLQISTDQLQEIRKRYPSSDTEGQKGSSPAQVPS